MDQKYNFSLFCDGVVRFCMLKELSLDPANSYLILCVIGLEMTKEIVELRISLRSIYVFD